MNWRRPLILAPRHQKKHESSRINISSSDSDCSFSSDIEWYERIKASECKEMSKLYNVVTNNINNINQFDDAIEYEPKFDNKFSLYSGTKYPPTIVTVSLQGGKKYRSTIISSLTCLWDSGATNSMIKRKHTWPYDCKMRSNKAE